MNDGAEFLKRRGDARSGPTSRQGQHAPNTPPLDGKPPGWIVRCLNCTFAVDEHAESAEDAVAGVRPEHDNGHRLVAKPIDYSQHPLYQR